MVNHQSDKHFLLEIFFKSRCAVLDENQSLAI